MRQPYQLEAHEIYPAVPSRSWAMEVQTSGRPEWTGNACRYATEREATDAGAELAGRWYAVDQWRAVPSPDPVNYVFQDGRTQPINAGGTDATKRKAPKRGRR